MVKKSKTAKRAAVRKPAHKSNQPSRKPGAGVRPRGEPPRVRMTAVGGRTSSRIPKLLAQARFASVVAERERLTESIDSERAERMAAYAAAIQMHQMRNARGKEGRDTAQQPLVTILAEGDSWFDYLGTDVISALEKLIDTPILNMAHKGDEVRLMLALRQRKEIEKRIARGAPDGRPWDALLFSGGGNDFVGDELTLWLNTFKTGMAPDQVVNSRRFDAVMEVVRGGYEDLVEICGRLSSTTKIFLHEYDFAPPNGRGICGIGPWLKPSLDFRTVPPDQQAAVTHVMLQRFASVVRSVKNGPHGDSVVVVPTQGALPAQTDDWWANELHPSPKGFEVIAAKFRLALQREFPLQALGAKRE